MVMHSAGQTLHEVTWTCLSQVCKESSSWMMHLVAAASPSFLPARSVVQPLASIFTLHDMDVEPSEDE